MVTELENCRVCGSKDLTVVVDLGVIYPSGFLKPDEKVSEETKAPLVLCRCEECGLIQLKHTVDLDLMYRQYWYASSLNKSMVRSLQDVVDDIMNKTALLAEDIVVDIGCNDGTMLNMFPAGVYKVGFDPALNLHKPDCNMFVNDYFTAEAYNFVFKKKAKVIAAIAMFYDLPSPVDFVKDVASILDEDGLFVIQFTDLRSMFEACAFDNICNEHLEYYGLEDVVNILNRADLRVIDVSYNDVNGGSIRVTATHRDSSRKSADIVVDTLVEEWKYFKYHDFGYFADRIKDTKTRMEVFLNLMKEKGNTLHLLGASTKGSTFLQYCGITNKDVVKAADVNPDKWGLVIAGTSIPIVSQEESLSENPDVYLVPIWHFKASLLKNDGIQDYIQKGGKLVFPLPVFTIVSSDGEQTYEQIK